MLDLKFVRENPEIVKQNIKNKFQDQKLPLVDEVIALDVENRKAQQEADALRSNRKTISKQIGALMAQGKREEAEELKNKVNAQAATLAELEAKGEKYTPEVKEAMKNASIKKGQTGLMFIGVCTAALFVIPAVCSLVIKPIMNAIGLKAPDDGKKHNTNDKKLDITEGLKPEQKVNSVQVPQVQTPQPTKQPVKQIEKPQMQTLFNGTASGMKVGGL